MSRACKIIGVVLGSVGIAMALLFVVVIARDENYRRTAMALERNPGNVMYEAEFKGAQFERALQAVGVIVGLLLSINGGTLLGLGVLAGRVPRKEGSER